MFFLQPYQTNLLMKCTRFISSALLCISSDEMLSVFGVEQQIPSICCTLWNDAVEEYSEDIAVSLPSLQETEVSGMGLTGCSSAFEPSLALVSSDFFSFAPSIPFVCWLVLLAKLRTLFYSRHFSKSRLVLRAAWASPSKKWARTGSFERSQGPKRHTLLLDASLSSRDKTTGQGSQEPRTNSNKILFQVVAMRLLWRKITLLPIKHGF